MSPCLSINDLFGNLVWPSFLYDILFSILDHISYSEDFPIIVISRQLSSPSIERDVAMHLKCFEWNRKVQSKEIKSKHWELVHLYNKKTLLILYRGIFRRFVQTLSSLKTCIEKGIECFLVSFPLEWFKSTFNLNCNKQRFAKDC